LGSGVWGLGSGVWGLGSGVWGLGSGVWGLGSGVCGLGFGVWGLGVTGPRGVRPSSLPSWPEGFGVLRKGFGFWVWGSGLRRASLAVTFGLRILAPLVADNLICNGQLDLQRKMRATSGLIYTSDLQYIFYAIHIIYITCNIQYMLYTIQNTRRNWLAGFLAGDLGAVYTSYTQYKLYATIFR